VSENGRLRQGAGGYSRGDRRRREPPMLPEGASVAYALESSARSPSRNSTTGLATK